MIKTGNVYKHGSIDFNREVVFMEGNIVQTLHLDETTIHICDDYCRDKTQEETEKILKTIAEQNLRYLQMNTA